MKILSALPLFLFIYIACAPHTSVSKTNAPSNNSKAVTSADLDSAIQQIFYYTNLERKKANLLPLVKNDKLMSLAASYAALMAKEGELSHEVNGKTMLMRFTAVGYTWKYIGENVAANSDLSGQSAVQDLWMHSTGHRANILNNHYTETGIGVAYSSKQNIYYYCQDFGEAR